MAIPLQATNPAIQQALDAGRLTAPKLQTGPTQGENFAQTLMDVMKDVNNSQQQAGQLQDDFISGRRPVEYHDLMISMEKASSTLQLTMAVRNKMLDAYQEIDRMQV
jgi:flagellar hook-basal body complex protein FliE